MESINIVLTAETIQAGLDHHLANLFKMDSYNHPVRSMLEKLFSSYEKDEPEARAKLKEVVKQAVLTKMDTPEFQLMVQQAIANEVAKKAVEHMKNEKKSPW